jgi:hypothetical protein
MIYYSAKNVQLIYAKGWSFSNGCRADPRLFLPLDVSNKASVHQLYSGRPS